MLFPAKRGKACPSVALAKVEIWESYDEANPSQPPFANKGRRDRKKVVLPSLTKRGGGDFVERNYE